MPAKLHIVVVFFTSVSYFFYFQVLPEITVTSEEELHDLSLQAQQLKHDILREQEKSSKEQKTSTDGYTQKTRKEERLRKKLAEVEARLVLASPDLPLKLYHMEGRVSN